jgi:phosphoglycerol transferase MdoB-like AlkP superfamily enzyme
MPVRPFFINNGFNTVIDQRDYKDPVFTGSWGVSDEDLFNKAHEEFTKKNGTPFFSLVFSSSNHVPFGFPAGRIDLYDQENNTVNNAVKYADYAVGEFIKKAKQSNYWENTLFLIVADHNSRVYGPNLVPIERFHIPGLILGADIKPVHYSKIASQIDLMPTLLSLAGIESITPAIGRDLNKLPAQTPGRAMMQYNATHAYMEDNKVIVFERNKQPKQYTYDNGKLNIQKNSDEQLLNKALAESLFGTYMYEHQLYKMP